MQGHRYSLPILPNLAKILFYETNLLKEPTLPCNQQKSPLRSKTLSQKLKTLRAKSLTSFLKTQKEETENFAQTSSQQIDAKVDNLTAKIEIKLDNSVQSRDLVPPKKHLPKLYTESMYKKYSEKVNALIEKRVASNISSSNLADDADGANPKLRESAIGTDEQSRNCYSIKYMTVKDEGIEIFSKRVPINQLESRSSRTRSIGKTMNSLVRNGKICDSINAVRIRNTEFIKKIDSFDENGKRVNISLSRQNMKDSEENLWDLKQTVSKGNPKESSSLKDFETKVKDNNCKIINALKEIDKINLNTEEKAITNDQEFSRDRTQSPRPDSTQKISTRKLLDPLEDSRSIAYGGDQQKQKLTTLSDSTPKEICTNYVVNKFIFPNKLKAIRKNNINNQKKIEAVAADPEKLNREVYMTTNFASFERQVASLNKLKNTMLRGRIKTTFRLEGAKDSYSDFARRSLLIVEPRQSKKDPRRSSYSRLLHSVYNQEELESDVRKEMRSLEKGINKVQPADGVENEELHFLKKENYRSNKSEKMLKRQVKSQSYRFNQDQTNTVYLEGPKKL